MYAFVRFYVDFMGFMLKKGNEEKWNNLTSYFQIKISITSIITNI